jgi:hypothetical protein
MRILVTIPHFYGPPTATSVRLRHGSKGADPRLRQAALTACVQSVHRLFHPAQCIIHANTRRTKPANWPLATQAPDVVIVTTGKNHLFQALPLPADAAQQHETDADPALLGFECHAVQREKLGEYDYYCYLEDDLILHDPWLFRKLTWFNGHVGHEKVLLPNRFEYGDSSLVYKAYVDGNLRPGITARWQNHPGDATLRSRMLNTDLVLTRPTNPHCGCYFLNARQMETWAESDHFLDRDTSFMGPLESAATLGLLKTFALYKPAPENASFLEVEHFGTSFLAQLRRPSS